MKPIEFKNNLHLTLRGYVHEPRKYDKAIIYLHGFPGHAGRTAKRFCQTFVKHGCLCMRFDFSGTDTSDGRFEDKLMSQEVKDIKYAIDYLEKNYDFKELILAGGSTGAIDAGLYAFRDKRISRLILIGTVFDLKESVRYDFTDLQVKDFWTKGYITYNRPGKWYHKKRLSKAFYDEFFRLNLPLAIKKYRRPLLILHGENDEYIPLSESMKMLRHASRPKKLVVIKHANHDLEGGWKEATKQVLRFA